MPKLETIYSENSSDLSVTTGDEDDGDQTARSRADSTPSTEPRSRFTSIVNFDDEQFIAPTLAMVQSPPLYDPAFLTLRTGHSSNDAESIEGAMDPPLDISLRISHTASDILPPQSEQMSIFSRASSKSIEVHDQNREPRLLSRGTVPGVITPAQSITS